MKVDRLARKTIGMGAFNAMEAYALKVEALAREAGEVLVIARAFMRGQDMEFCVTNHPQQPQRCLGQDLDEMITKLRAAGLLKGGE